MVRSSIISGIVSSICTKEVDLYKGRRYNTEYSVYNLLEHINQYKKTSSITNKPKGVSSIKKFTADILSLIKETITVNSDFTLKQIKEVLKERNKTLNISLAKIDKALKQLIVTVKKEYNEIERMRRLISGKEW